VAEENFHFGAVIILFFLSFSPFHPKYGWFQPPATRDGGGDDDDEDDDDEDGAERFGPARRVVKENFAGRDRNNEDDVMGNFRHFSPAT
jgi:hypothetical protein